MSEILKSFDLVPLDAIMIAVSAALFVVLWKTLGKALFEPYVALVEARESATIGANDTAYAERAKASALYEDYEQKLMSARVAAMEKKLSAISKAKEEADGLVEKAEDAAQELVRSVRWEMAKSVDELRTKAFGEVDALADMIVSRVKNPATRSSAKNS